MQVFPLCTIEVTYNYDFFCFSLWGRGGGGGLESSVELCEQQNVQSQTFPLSKQSKPPTPSC